MWNPTALGFEKIREKVAETRRFLVKQEKIDETRVGDNVGLNRRGYMGKSTPFDC